MTPAMTAAMNSSEMVMAASDPVIIVVHLLDH